MNIVRLLCDPIWNWTAEVIISFNVSIAPRLSFGHRAVLEVRSDNCVRALRWSRRVAVTRTIDNEDTRACEKFRHLTGRTHWSDRITDSIDKQHGGTRNYRFKAREKLACRRNDICG